MIVVGLGQASNDVSSIAASKAVPALAGLLVLAAGAAWWISRRPRRIARPTLAWFAGFASVAVIVAVTLFRDGLPTRFNAGGLAHWSTAGLRLLSRDPLGSSQFMLNVVLFVPAGMTWTWPLGASRRQQRVESALRVAFAGTDRSSIEVILAATPNAVFGAVTDVADGIRRSDDALEIRYPATFFSLHRCVFVVWTSTSVDFRKASGQDCTDFIDSQLTVR
jgi:hypothetical protein